MTELSSPVTVRPVPCNTVGVSEPITEPTVSPSVVIIGARFSSTSSPAPGIPLGLMYWGRPNPCRCRMAGKPSSSPRRNLPRFPCRRRQAQRFVNSLYAERRISVPRRPRVVQHRQALAAGRTSARRLLAAFLLWQRQHGSTLDDRGVAYTMSHGLSDAMMAEIALECSSSASPQPVPRPQLARGNNGDATSRLFSSSRRDGGRP